MVSSLLSAASPVMVLPALTLIRLTVTLGRQRLPVT
jgi:hypothetical protein